MKLIWNKLCLLQSCIIVHKKSSRNKEIRAIDSVMLRKHDRVRKYLSSRSAEGDYNPSDS